MKSDVWIRGIAGSNQNFRLKKKRFYVFYVKPGLTVKPFNLATSCFSSWYLQRQKREHFGTRARFTNGTSVVVAGHHTATLGSAETFPACTHTMYFKNDVLALIALGETPPSKLLSDVRYFRCRHAIVIMRTSYSTHLPIVTPWLENRGRIHLCCLIKCSSDS